MQIEDFPLAWRWTNERYALFPPNVLATIEPLSGSEALVLWRNAQEKHDASGLDPRRYLISTCDVSDSDQEAGCAWLESQHLNTETPIFLSWTPELAVATNWHTFTHYWSDFCYPSSDDVFIYSPSETWLLVYQHSEFFEFGVMRNSSEQKSNNSLR